MKLTTLNKLEKHLRASRGREVPDLKPPNGGWEAINAKLTVDPVEDQASIDQSATSSWIKWGTGGLGIILLVVAAVFMPPRAKVAPEQQGIAATQQALGVTKVKVLDGEVTSSSAERKKRGEKEDKDILRSEGTDTPASTASDKVIDRAGEVKFTEQRGETVVAHMVKQQEKFSRNAGSSENVVSDDGGLTGIDVPETNPALLGDKLEEVSLIDIDTSQRRMAVPEAKPETFADNSQNVYLPVELPLTMPKGLRSTAQWPTAIVPELPPKKGFFSSRRFRVRPEWQFHGSISGFVGEDFDGTLAYDVAPAGSSEIFFVRPSGGLIHVAPEAVRRNSNRLEQLYLKAGINRQTSSGFLFRSSIGLFRSKSFQIGPEGVLMADQVEVKTAKNQTIVPVELGLQYTFLRRRRIKPYVGVHMVGYLNYLGVDESYFTEGATAEEGLVSRFSSQEFIALIPDLAVTLGLQYQISSKISAGAFLWGNTGGNLFVRAPLGMEIRYSLK